MAQQLRSVDVSDSPVLRDLVEEVTRTQKAKRLRVGASDMEVVVSPAKVRSRRHSLTLEERREQLHASFGAWKDLIDPEQLKRELNELQRDDTSPRSW